MNSTNTQSQPQTRITLNGNTFSIALADMGQGRTYLLLHGGAGPGSVMGLAGALSLSNTARAIVPTHPGFQGQARPEWLQSVPDLASAYLAMLEAMDLKDVIVVGNSLGGWIAAEMATRKSPRVAGIVLLNAMGVESGAHGKLADMSKVSPAERTAMAFHDPAKFAIAPASPEAAAAMAENQKTLRIYGGQHFTFDPTLRARLGGIAVPALVAWGESDRIVDVAYGREFAESIPGARFVAIPEAGHLPQIEKTAAVLELLAGFPAHQ